VSEEGQEDGQIPYAGTKIGGGRVGSMKPCSVPMWKVDSGALKEVRSNNSYRCGATAVH